MEGRKGMGMMKYSFFGQKTQPPCCSVPSMKLQLVRSSLTSPCVTAPTASRLLGSILYSCHAKGGVQLILFVHIKFFVN